jgi:hypothetical protein
MLSVKQELNFIYSTFNTPHNLYFPKNAVYFIILSFSVQILLIVFRNNAIKFKSQPGYLKVRLQ